MEYTGPTAEMAGQVVACALSGGGDMADLFVEERRSLSLRLEDGRVESVTSASDLGGSIRVTRGLSSLFGYADAVDEAALGRLAGELSGTQTQGDMGVMVVVERAEGKPPTSMPPRVTQKEIPSDAAGRARLLHIADETARSVSSEVRQVIAGYAESRQRVWIATSDGLLSSDDRIRVSLAITVMTQRGGLIQIGRDGLALRDGFRLPDDDEVISLATDVARRAVTMLDSEPAPTGRMPVVLANGFGGVLFHEACGHGLEADYILKKTSVWEGKIGCRVAPEFVFAYDDGLGEGMWGTGACDDEGTPSERTTLIEAGVLTGYLTDRLRAVRLGLTLTGNGRRQDYRYLPYPRMTNTYFGADRHTPQEIIADTPRALYAKSLSGGEVNPATGDFVFGVAEGYLIENGKITTPVRGATLIGSGLEVLQGIDAVADDLEMKPGTCGKEGQGVPVGTGQPTLRIRELTVGGTSLS
ncbi:MAG: TldD/PmbA family protein [Actinobacteria bacterium]|nr:TldD/PmbA family protein [Actinomycetota bacterium]